MSNSTVFRLFKQRYEEQAGRVWLTTSPDDTVGTIGEILSKTDARKAVFTAITPEVDDKLPQLFEGAGISTLFVNPHESTEANQISEMDVGISQVAFAIAFTGTIVEITTQDIHRLVSSLPRIHIAVLKGSEILEDLTGAAAKLRETYRGYPRNCNVSFISGPSRTADIEMKLFLGVHGPQESHVIVRDW